MKKNKRFAKYSSIGQFREVVHTVRNEAHYIGKDDEGNPLYDETREKPVITFKGTVKIHGTNAGIGYNKEFGLWAQKRTSVITPQNDNAGFAFFVEQNKEWFTKALSNILCNWKLEDYENTSLVLYGEWCGLGVQKNVSVSNLPKMFVIFGLKIMETDSEGNQVGTWTTIDLPSLTDNLPEHVYNIEQFQTFETEIDFDNPSEATNKMIALTEEVERECPVGKALGVPSDGNTIGEGICWTAEHKGNRYIFKVKGTKHAKGTGKVKVLTAVDEALVKSVDDFCLRYGATQSRLQQMFKDICNEELNRKLLGPFIKAVIEDTIKEEIDIMTEFNLEPKQISKRLGELTRFWFFEKEKF